MRPADIDRFFTLLGGRLPFRVTVILTGGGAAILEGVFRATQDLDFQIALKGATAGRRQVFQNALADVERITGIAAQYDASIESWSSISWPSSRAKSYRYRQFKTVEVRILDPLWWSVGKMTRYLSYDVSDIVTVFKRMKIRPEQAVRAWGKALGRSPFSAAQPVFKRQVFDFIDHHGRKVWGIRAKPESLRRIFLKAARRN